MPQQSFAVFGQVKLQNGQPADGVLVRAFDRDLRREELLGEAITGQDGRYTINYTDDMFTRAEKKSADLVVRVFNRVGALLAERGVLFNAPLQASVDLTLDADAPVTPSEYELLLADLTPLMDGLAPAELTDEDVAFLYGDLSLDQQQDRRIDILVQGARLAQATALSSEFFYGVARQLPLDPPLNLDAFLTRAPEIIKKAFEEAIRRNIIPAQLRVSLDEFVSRLDRLRVEHGFLERRQVIVRLVNEKTGKPLESFAVQVFDLDDGGRDLGYEVTDDHGQLAIVYTAPHRSTPTDNPEAGKRRLRLQIRDQQGQPIAEQDIEVRLDQQPFDVRITLAALPEPPSPALAELTASLKVALPQVLADFLAARGIRTLTDVRSAGGIRSLDGLPVPSNDAAIHALEAHANLSALSDDITLNAELIQRRFNSIAAIASTTRPVFVRAVRDYPQLGDFKAARLHVMAQAQARFLNSVLAGLRADAANGLPSTLLEISDD